MSSKVLTWNAVFTVRTDKNTQVFNASSRGSLGPGPCGLPDLGGEARMIQVPPHSVSRASSLSDDSPQVFPCDSVSCHAKRNFESVRARGT